MTIPEEFLKETNYSGTRLVEVDDEVILDYQKKLAELQLEINPLLEKTKTTEEEVSKLQIIAQNLQNELKVVRGKAAELQEPHKEDYEEMHKIDAKAVNIKNKLNPLVMRFVSDKLGEFETARQLREIDGKLYVEIFDEIEEKIKAIRASKSQEVKQQEIKKD